MNNPPTNESLVGRLEVLETANRHLQQQSRRWKRVGLGMIAGLAVVAIGGAAAVGSRPTIEAGEFVLRDEAGRMRAALAMRPDGTPGLGLFDEHGKARLSMAMRPDGAPAIDLHDNLGILRAALAMRPDGTPGFGLFDLSGRVRVSLDVGPDGTSGVNIYDPSGTLRAAVAMRPDGTPGVGLFDASGQVMERVEPRHDLVIAPELR